ncbi:MAG: triose-phosphate isomerase family protein, partial [Patescibacteria group bacterium]
GHYTGEISPKMLKNLGVEYVIIGHSERRRHLNETDEMINKKVLATLKTELKVILCVGEPLEIRKKGKKAIENFIKNQLQKDLKRIENLKLKIKNLAIAYEPIWAIGAGHSDTPEDALEMIKYIKKFLQTTNYKLQTKVLYGGSVDGKNIKNFLKYDEIDGFLIGHASLNKNEIKTIIKSI